MDTKQLAKKLGLTVAQTRDLSRYLTSYVDGKAPAIKGQMAKNIVNALRGHVSEETLAHAGELSARAFDSMASQMSDTALNSLGERLGDAIAEGKRPRDMGRFLEEVTELDSNRAASLQKKREYWEAQGLSPSEVNAKMDREFERALRKRRETIAHTEGREITANAREMEGKARGAKKKYWMTVGDDRVGDDHRENEEAGPIPIDQPFPSGDQRPPGRPNCRCTIAYITSDKAEKVLRKRHKERLDAQKESE